MNLVRMIARIALLFFPLLFLTCSKPGSKRAANCAEKSNTIMVGNSCECRSGYRRESRGSNFICIMDRSSCRGGAIADTSGNCQCSNGNIYDAYATSPCGSSTAGTLDRAQLQRVCQSASAQGATWDQSGICTCGGTDLRKRQFNARSGLCEPFSLSHTRTMCGSNATFYGANDQGLCVCRNSNAFFHPSFGGCTSSSLGLNVSQNLCTSVYGGEFLHDKNYCQCPNQEVWFRGSCLNLAQDFFVSAANNMPPEILCEVKGGRIVGGECLNSSGFGGGGGGFGSIYQHRKVSTCDRSDARLNIDERVVISSNYVDVIDYISNPSTPLRYRYNNPQDYFRERCVNRAVSSSGLWLRGYGTYNRIGDNRFTGSCNCGFGFITKRHPDLGYEYCAEDGGYYDDPRCHWDWKRDTELSVTFDPKTGIGVSGCVNRNGRKWCISTGR